MKFVTMAELNRDIVDNLHLIPKDIDIIVGVPRSGMLIAAMIALYLNKPLCDLNSFVQGRIYSVGMTKNTKDCILDFWKIRKALIVEDSSNSGASIERAKETVQKVDLNIKCSYLAVYVTEKTKDNVDIWFRIVEPPRMFEWGFMHHESLQYACVDIDGVLCRNPTVKENDDGERYRNFIRTAEPKYIPTRKVGCIVTSRLEKYREDTEYWLKMQGIEYDRLYMMKLETAEERRKLGNHAIFKAEVFKKEKKTNWFIESDLKEAKEIAALSGKEVFCVDKSVFAKAALKYRMSWKLKMQLYAVLIKYLPYEKVDQIRKLKRKLLG
ncbi:MAG: phosphoribosyltransferase [Hungatella sp.]|nr:phosphoribosyltransferase [Hungatella sp.]